jgi:threonine/homoserine/homoserine lactone efflux protein
VDALFLGLTIGLAAGVSPGPLLVLVITSTLRSGWRAGALAACAPLLSDAIVVGGVLLVLDRLPERSLSVLGVVGGPSPALRQAALVNVFSPHPWLTWATALGPLTPQPRDVRSPVGAGDPRQGISGRRLCRCSSGPIRGWPPCG